MPRLDIGVLRSDVCERIGPINDRSKNSSIVHLLQNFHTGCLILGRRQSGGRHFRPNEPDLIAKKVEMVRQGLGIGILDATIGDAEPLVQQVRPDLAPITFPIWLVAHRALNTNRRITVVFDLLANELARF